MDSRQERSLKTFGFSLEEIENVKKVPKVTLYNKQGEALHNLPADLYHMERYLKRGFTIKPPLTEPQVEVKVEPQGEIQGFQCETCGKVLQTRLALAGHSRSHKKGKRGE